MILNDFKCNSCTELAEYSYRDKKDVVCMFCGSMDVEVVFTSFPSIRTLNDRSKVKDALKRRSQMDHIKHGRDRKVEAYEKAKIW